MKILIFPDIHLEHDKIVAALQKEETYDKAIFLGDYFDNFNDTVAQHVETAKWLKISLKDPRHVHLMGNHDIPYIYPANRMLYNGGTRGDRIHAARSVMKQEDWDKLRVYHVQGEVLFTHAGVHSIYVSEHFKLPNKLSKPAPLGMEVLESWLAAEEVKMREACKTFNHHWMISVGYSRGGNQMYGGPMWCDFNRDMPDSVEFVKQVVGHTPAMEPRTRDGVLCLDTQVRHYGVWDGKGEIEIRKHPPRQESSMQYNDALRAFYEKATPEELAEWEAILKGG